MRRRGSSCKTDPINPKPFQFREGAEKKSPKLVLCATNLHPGFALWCNASLPAFPTAPTLSTRHCLDPFCVIVVSWAKVFSK